MKNTLKNIIYNCRKATLLIEKKHADSLTIREKLELKTHLANCSGCRLFEQQSIVITHLLFDLFHKPQVNRLLKLDDDFKKSLQEQIIEKLNNN